MSKEQHKKSNMPKVISAAHSNDDYPSLDIGGDNGKQIGYVRLGGTNGKIFYIPSIEVTEGNRVVIPDLDVEFSNAKIVLHPGSFLEVSGVCKDICELTTIGSAEELEAFSGG